MTDAPSTLTLSEWRSPRRMLEGKSALDQLWNRLDGAYPGRFASLFKTPQSITNWKDAWEEGLLAAGIKTAEVASALTRLPSGWPPGLPDFIALCRPPIDPEQAFYVAVDGMQARQRGEIGTWPHPAIYWAAVRIGQHDMLAAGYSGLKGRWANALQDVLSKGRWEEVPEPALALPAPGASVTSSEEARKRLEQLGAVGVVRRPSANKDTEWAERILARDAAGKDVPGIAALSMARKALGISDGAQA